MGKKLKVKNCLECKNHTIIKESFKVKCYHDKFDKTRDIATAIIVKANNVIPNWCPLEDWEE